MASLDVKVSPAPVPIPTVSSGASPDAFLHEARSFAQLRSSNRHLLRGESARIASTMVPVAEDTPEKMRVKRDAPPLIDPVLQKRFPGLRTDSFAAPNVKLILPEGEGGGSRTPSRASGGATGASRGGGAGGIGSRGAASAGYATPGFRSAREGRVGAGGGFEEDRRGGTAPVVARRKKKDEPFELAAGSTSHLWDPELTRSSMKDINSLQNFRRSIQRHKPVVGAGTTSMDKIVGERKKRKPEDIAKGKKALAERPPFAPSGPAFARAAISSDMHSFVNAYSEYNSFEKAERAAEHRRRMKCLAGEFKVKTAAAKDLVKNKAFLNSPDEEALEAERLLVRERVMANQAAMTQRMAQVRVKRREKFPVKWKQGAPPRSTSALA